MNVEQQLIQFGLTKSQANVYLALLKLGQTTILEIAKETKLKRASIYNYIEELINLGLVSKIPIGTKIYFKAENPLLLLSHFQKKQKSL